MDTLEYKVKVPKVSKDQVLICKVGSEDHPATEGDIKIVQAALATISNNPDLTFVSHHYIEFVVVERNALNNVIIVGNIDGLINNINRTE